MSECQKEKLKKKISTHTYTHTRVCGEKSVKSRISSIHLSITITFKYSLPTLPTLPTYIIPLPPRKNKNPPLLLLE